MEENNVLNKISVILIHPFEIPRKAIALLLAHYGYKITREANSIESIKNDTADCDLILIHYKIYKPGGLITEIIEKSGASIALLGSSFSYDEKSYEKMTEQIREGITGFLDMDEPLENFLSELHQLAMGDIVISKRFVHNLRQKAKISDKPAINFSNRELQILELLSHGDSNKEIGKELFLSEHTVKIHLRSILNKLNLKNRQQAIVYAIRNAVIPELKDS